MSMFGLIEIFFKKRLVLLVKLLPKQPFYRKTVVQKLDKARSDIQTLTTIGHKVAVCPHLFIRARVKGKLSHIIPDPTAKSQSLGRCTRATGQWTVPHS